MSKAADETPGATLTAGQKLALMYEAKCRECAAEKQRADSLAEENNALVASRDTATSLLAMAKAEERERACKAMCSMCRDGVPWKPQDVPGNHPQHLNPFDGGGDACMAWPIRALPDPPAGSAK